MKLPFEVAFVEDSNQFSPITPKFPNWNKSFVSGSNSPLFEVAHFEHHENKNLILTKVRFKDLALGPPGHVHGGASAAIIDEVMGVCVWNLKHPSVTQSLSLHYGRAIPLKIEAFIYTEVKQTHPKTIQVQSTIYDKEKTPYISAEGIFHRLTPEQLARFSIFNQKQNS